VQRFKKRKEKSIHRRIYTAVDHLNFRVTKQSCFGLLGMLSSLYHLVYFLLLMF